MVEGDRWSGRADHSLTFGKIAWDHLQCDAIDAIEDDEDDDDDDDDDEGESACYLSARQDVHTLGGKRSGLCKKPLGENKNWNKSTK